MVKVYVANLGKYNEGFLVGEWLDLPASPEKIKKLLRDIGINEQYEEFAIHDYESSIPGLDIWEYENLSKLNDMVTALVENKEHLDCIKAIYDWKYYSFDSCCENILTSIQELEGFNFLPGVMNEEELGTYMLCESGSYTIPAEFESYIDYEAWGRDYHFNSQSHFSPLGFIEKL